ncbi:MAG TPA: EF-hand domain-containing protein [Povalibacter sp.]|nr:EF-hand domain-containing protein [Povalibacter sp.]
MRDVTREELSPLRQSFDACDSNSDGWISHQEFIALLKDLDHDLSDDECLLAFEATDDDGDGLISFEEFMAWWTDA